MDYLNRWKLKKKSDSAFCNPARLAKEDAKQEICQFVKKCVIAENEAVYISSLLEKYRQIYLQKGGPPDALKNYSSTNMKKFILKRLGAHGVEIVSDSTKKLVVKKVGELSDESLLLLLLLLLYLLSVSNLHQSCLSYITK